MDLIKFPSGHMFRTEVIKYVEPVFTVRRAITLRVVAGPENPDSDASILIDNTTVIDVEFRAFGDFPDHIVVEREDNACVLEAGTSALNESEFYLEVLQAMKAAQSEELMGQITIDTRAIHQYHAAWREASHAPDVSDDVVHNPLIMDSLGERLPPEKWATRIVNRTARMAKRLREAGVLVNSVEDDIHGVWALLDFLKSQKIDYSPGDTADLMKLSPKVDVIYSSDSSDEPSVGSAHASAAA